MIVTAQDEGLLRLITQNDHAHFSAEMLSLWVADGLPEHPRRRELLFAAREHDNGWRETDSAPFHDPTTGKPHDFTTLDREERWRIWRRGPERFAEREPYAALLITRHALTLHANHRQDSEWSEVFAAWRQLEEELLETTGIREDELAADYQWIDLTDLISLALCASWARPLEHQPLEHQPLERHGFRLEVRGNDLAVSPFPLAGATTFQVPCRTIPDRRYTSDSDLAVELAMARWGHCEMRLVELS